MRFYCVKVRPTTGAYTDVDLKAMPTRCFEVHFRPINSQHLVNGIAELRIWLWRECPFEQGKEYEIPISIPT